MTMYLEDSQPETFVMSEVDTFVEIRGARGALSIARIDPATFAFRAALHSGQSIATAAGSALERDATFDAGAALRRLVLSGLATQLSDASEGVERLKESSTLTAGSPLSTRSSSASRCRSFSSRCGSRVGAAFFRSGLLKVNSWEFAVQLFRDEYKVPLLDPVLAAQLATVVELGVPLYSCSPASRRGWRLCRCSG